MTGDWRDVYNLAHSDTDGRLSRRIVVTSDRRHMMSGLETVMAGILLLAPAAAPAPTVDEAAKELAKFDGIRTYDDDAQAKILYRLRRL